MLILMCVSKVFFDAQVIKLTVDITSSIQHLDVQAIATYSKTRAKVCITLKYWLESKDIR